MSAVPAALAAPANIKTGEMAQPPHSAIILFAHGSRETEWAAPFKKLQSLVAQNKSGVPVELAFLEIMQPCLGEAIDKLVQQGAASITVVPAFLAQGRHLKQDLPRMLELARKRHPAITFHVSPALGEVDEILDMIAQWVSREHSL